MLDLSLNFRFGFFVRRCFAHLAGGINLKNGGKNGRVIFKNNKLNDNIALLILVVLIP